MKPAENIKRLIKNSHITTSSTTDSRIIGDALTELETLKKKQSAHSRPKIRRRIMKSRTTKLAAAAVIIVIYLSFQISNNIVSTAYALQDTVEAYNSIRYLHISEFEMVGQERRPSDIWVACDHYGRIDKMRWEAPNSGGPLIGAMILVSDRNISKVWFKDYNLCLKTIGDAGAVLRWEISELDPKLVFERLSEQQKHDEIIVDVNEPENKSKPIVITVTYPQESLSQAYKKVLYVDQATELVKKIEKFQMKDGKYHHVRTAEFSDYNDQIDPMMFSFDDELPPDTIYLDRSKEEIGLAQGNMTDDQVVAEVGRKFFEAIIAKDFDKAGLIWSGAPSSIVEKAFMGANVVEIISIGQSRPNPDPDATSMIGSCKVLVEIDSQFFELDAFWIHIRRVSTQPDRWKIIGMASHLLPVED